MYIPERIRPFQAAECGHEDSYIAVLLEHHPMLARIAATPLYFFRTSSIPSFLTNFSYSPVASNSSFPLVAFGPVPS